MFFITNKKGETSMDKNIQHGNFARIDKHKKTEPAYQTLTVTSKKESNVNSKTPVTPVLDENVVLSKHEVDENHK